jgi:hypothetical protein
MGGHADSGADIGGTRDHRLNGLAGSLRADILKHEAVLFENAGILAECRRLIFPIVDLADHELKRILRRSRPDGQRERNSEHAADCLERFHAFSSLDALCLFAYAPLVSSIQHPGPFAEKLNVSAPLFAASL